MRSIALDIETIGLNPYGGTIWMLSLTEGRKTRLIDDCFGIKKIPADVKRDLENPKVMKVIHSSQLDVPYCEMVWGIKIKNIWDTELCETVIQGISFQIKRKNIEPGSASEKLLKAHSTALDFTLPRYGFKTKMDKSIRENFIDRPLGKPFTKKEKDYAIGDTKDLLALQRAQEYILERDDLIKVARLENEVAERYHDMKVRGIGFSRKIWEKISYEQLREYEKRMAKLPKDVDNWGSEKQVKAYFKKKGIFIPGYSELDKIYLQTRNKTLGDFINTRELSKAVAAYGFNWFEEGYIDPDDRVRPYIRQIINTGRNAMADPNLQQLPGSGNSDPLRLKVLQLVTGATKKAMLHRTAFIPKPGHVFVICDYGGQEIGIMAAASNEELWINALLRGEDVHSLTASVINPTEWARATEKGCSFPKKCRCAGHKKLREPAKINNFMLAYGGGPQKFADFVGTDIVTASAYVAAHKRVIPNLTRYLNLNGQEALATGVAFSADPYRRRRVLHGDEDWQIINQGKNTPIQSAGANMLKLGLASIPWKYPVVLVIHDEIIAEVPKEQAMECAKAMKTVMEKSADYITGIKGLIHVEPKIQMNIMKDLPTTTKISQIKTGEYAFAA